MNQQEFSIAVVASRADEKPGTVVADGLERRGRRVGVYPIEEGEEAMRRLFGGDAPYRAIVVVVSRGLAAEARRMAFPTTAALPVFALLYDGDMNLDHLAYSAIAFHDPGRWDEQLDNLSTSIDKVLYLTEEAAGEQHQTVGTGGTAAPGAMPPDDLILALTDDRRTVVAEYTITSALADALVRARRLRGAFLAVRPNEPELSSSAVLFGLAATGTPLGQWFRAFITRTGVDIDTPLRLLNRTAADLADLAAERLSPPTQRWAVWTTLSVRSLMETAQQYAGDAPVDVYHLAAACMYHPGSHAGEYAVWKLDREQWSNSFLGLLAVVQPEEQQRYMAEHSAVLSSTPAITQIDVPREQEAGSVRSGPSPHIASDRWTTDDTLNFSLYADAIFRFLTHERTIPPLTISIQAPWGGGKTSLMRMIQQRLDPEAVPPMPERKRRRSGGHTAQHKKTVPHSKLAGWLRTVWSSIAGAAQPEPRGKLTVGRMVREIEEWAAGTAEKPEFSNASRHLFTVWFNAWKYDSVNQVWAGLVDAITRQVADRLAPFDRERFWLQLHLKRVDGEKIGIDRLFKPRYKDSPIAW